MASAPMVTYWNKSFYLIRWERNLTRGGMGRGGHGGDIGEERDKVFLNNSSVSLVFFTPALGFHIRLTLLE